jgi:acyl-CoA synthetase (AMP-forming)/AMP-acid ligase II
LSAGQEAVGAEVRIVGEDGCDLAAGDVGEVLIKSRSVIQGYWKMPELNREIIQDGWFHTGDLGYLDEERYLFIVDRMKDMIISGGTNIYPKEIEEVFYAHPAVAEAAVVGVPDELWGESVKALVVLRDNHQAAEAELIDYCKDRLAGYKKPKSVEFLEELPKNPSGKILKRVLREKYWAGEARKC